MAKLVAFYSRADENYFSGGCRYVMVGNTEKLAKMISEMTGADLFKIEQKIPYAADYNTCIQQAKEDTAICLSMRLSIMGLLGNCWKIIAVFELYRKEKENAG